MANPLGKNVSYITSATGWKKPTINGGGSGDPPVERDVEKYIEAKAEGTRAMIEASAAKTEIHLNKILNKMDVLDEIPKMREDLAELKIAANNEVPRLIGQAVAIVLSILALGMVALNIFQSGASLNAAVGATAPTLDQKSTEIVKDKPSQNPNQE